MCIKLSASEISHDESHRKEMEAQALTRNQQKHTLSGKKQAKRKISVRNTLSTPYSPYWPVVSPENEAELDRTLKTLLPLAKRVYKRVPWSELRKLTKEQRQERRWCSDETSNNLSGSLVLGVNGVSRALQGGMLSCALVAGDVQPRILVSHLTTLSSVRGVPLLVLSSLRLISQVTLGFSCIALGVKKCVTDCKEHQFHPLLELVARLWRDVPQPDTLTGYLSTLAPDSSPEDSSASESETGNSPVHIEALYLRRVSRKERVFVPDNSQPSQPNTRLPTFIPLPCSDGGEYTPPTSGEQQHQPRTKFYPLTIKRIQPNPNKVRKRKKGNPVAST